MVQLNRTPNPIDRTARTEINKNWELIERSIEGVQISVNDATELAQAIDDKAQRAIDQSKNAQRVAQGVDAKANEALTLAGSANNQSTDAINLAEELREEVNQLVIQGDSSVEAAQARVGVNGIARPTLKDRIDDEVTVLTSQVARTDDISKRELPPRTALGFLFDDSPLQDYNVLLPIAREYGVPISIAVITDGSANRLSSPANVDKLHELVDVYGWDLLCHTDTHPRMTDLTYEQQELQMINNINKLVAAGFERPRGIAYPMGAFNEDTLKLARKYFEYGMRAGSNGINTSPLETYTIHRIQFDFTNTNNNFAWYKTRIDEAVRNNQPIIFMGHTAVVTQNRNWFDEEQQQLFRDVVEYAQSINVPVTTVTQIYDMFKNVYDSPVAEYSIGYDGQKSPSLASVKNLSGDSIGSSSLIAEFPLGESRKEFLSADGQTFPEVNGGTLITFRGTRNELSWQEWHPSGTQSIHKRASNSAGNWSVWRDTSKSPDPYSNFTFISDPAIVADSLITDFPQGESKKLFFTADGQTFPVSNGGTLVTHRHSANDLSWQEWHPAGSNAANATFLKRLPTSTGWTPWRAIGDVMIADSSTNATLANSYVVGTTIETLSNAFIANAGFPVTSGGSMLITQTASRPDLYATQRLIDSTGKQYTRIALGNVWGAWYTA